MLICCEKCEKHKNCVRKWIFGQKSIEQTCCEECGSFTYCLEKNIRRRWMFLHDFIDHKDLEGETGSEG
jgi:hypothetical protein